MQIKHVPKVFKYNFDWLVLEFYMFADDLLKAIGKKVDVLET